MKKNLSAYQLKMVGVGTMLLDHLNLFLPLVFPLWFRYIGRMSAPIFLFLSVESFFKTSSRSRYITRLGLAAVIVSAGDYLLWVIAKKYYFSGEDFVGLGGNIFFVLFFSVLIYYSLERFNHIKEWSEKMMWLAVALIISAVIMLIQDVVYYVGLVYLFYFFYKYKPNYLPIAYAIFSCVLLIFTIFSVFNISRDDYQWFMILAFVPFALYSGKRGRSSKYFFYFFYPIHRWILFSVGYYFHLG